MPIFARHTLFWKYAAFFSGLVSGLLVISGVLGGYFAYRQSTDALEELQLNKAQFLASEISSYIGRVEDALRSTVAKFNTTGEPEPEDLRLELIALLRYQQSVTELHWIAADGRERLALSRLTRDIADSAADWANDPRFQRARLASTYVGPVYFRGETEPYLSLAASRSRDGPALIAEANLKFVGDVLSKLRLGPAGVAYIVDSHGQLISHPDVSRVLSKTDYSQLPQVSGALAATRPGASSDEVRNLEGMPVVATAVPIEHLGWTVVMEQSRNEALRPVYASIARSGTLVVLGVIAAIATSLVFARRMVQPIRRLESSAREIGEGKLDQRIEVKTGDELEALAIQFNRMAERLHAIYATQETRIAERTHELARANEAKSRFVAAASHDLRQPMHALALFVGQLRANAGSAEAPALLEKIEHSVDVLQELFEALLDLSRLDMGAVTAQQRAFPANELLSRLVADFAPAAEAKGLALTLVPTSLWVFSDPLLLERIVRNVVANAVRYTQNGRILIGCRRRGEHVNILIADTGVGIDPTHLPKIFDEFYQVTPLSGTSAKGLGLGLAIVKRLAALLDHPVMVESRPGRGTLIRVQVRRAIARERQVPVAVAPAQDLHGTRVLVVEDEAHARDAIGGLLAQWGCEVIRAEGGEDALERTRNWRPDLVRCDVTLADGANGLAVVDRLHARHGPGLACAFVTGETAPHLISAVRARGHPILVKPAKPAKLRALIEHLRNTPG